MNTTEYALQILNDTDYGNEAEYTNGDILSIWSDGNEIRFIHEYLDFIIGTNGESELYDWEVKMAQDTGYKLNQDQPEEVEKL